MRYLWMSLLFLGGFFSVAANTFYVDPVNGSTVGDGSAGNPWSTLEWVFANNKIEAYGNVLPYDPVNPQFFLKNPGAPVKAGDTLLLLDGLHGDIFEANYNNTDYITVMAAPGATPILKRLRLQGFSKWRFVGLDISSEPYGSYINDKLVFLESHGWQGPTKHIIVDNCHIYSAASPWTTASDWVSKVSTGIDAKGDSINVQNCLLENVDFGITMGGDRIRVIGNSIVNFSADGIRLVGSYSLVEGNIIKNCYDVDANHDDGIQSFTTNGLVVDYDTVRNNIILNYEDPNQPLLGVLQGIGCFDGFYNHWIVENNVIIVDAYHGIAFLGANDVKIINNTVINPTPTGVNYKTWIMIDAHKDGTASFDCVVKNNASNQIIVNGNNMIQGNNVTVIDTTDYNNNFVDFAANNLHLTQNSILIDGADTIYAPLSDIEGTPRTFGTSPDIGAYEYSGALPVIYGQPLMAKREKKSVLLHWSVYLEVNNRGFFVQRSLDKKSWSEIGFVTGRGDATEEKQYQYIDIHPIEGRTYYRLKQIDFDGHSSYSGIVSVLYTSDYEKIKIYPNPVSDILSIDMGENPDDTPLNIYGPNGKLYKIIDPSPMDKIEVQVSGWEPGIYIIRPAANTGQVYKILIY